MENRDKQKDKISRNAKAFTIALRRYQEQQNSEIDHLVEALESQDINCVANTIKIAAGYFEQNQLNIRSYVTEEELK